MSWGALIQRESYRQHDRKHVGTIQAFAVRTLLAVPARSADVATRWLPALAEVALPQGGLLHRNAVKVALRRAAIEGVDIG